MPEDVLPVSSEMPVSDAKFTDSLSEDIRGEASLQNFKDVNSLAKSYVSAQKMIGSSLRIPTDDASPEDRAAFYNKLSNVPNVAILPKGDDKAAMDQFYNKLGRPESADGYNFNVDEGVELDTGKINEFKQIAHNLGLSQKQADELVKFEMARTEQMLQHAVSNRENAEKTLREAFGNDLDNRLAAAKDTVRSFGSKYPEALKELLNSSAGNNPIVVMMAAELGKLYRESGAVEGSRRISFGVTPEEAKQRIEEIRSNKSHAYFNERDPKHLDAVEHMSKLYAALGHG